MNPLGNVDFLQSSTAIKIAAFVFVSVAFFYLGKHWSDSNQQLVFFTRQAPAVETPAEVAFSPNFDKNFNISTLINETQTQAETKLVDCGKTVEKSAPSPSPVLPSASPPPPPSPPPPDQIKIFGVVDENGTMSDAFEIGEFGPELIENWGNDTEIHEEKSEESRVKFNKMKFGLCDQSMTDYIPCMDNLEAIKRLKSTDRGESFERHCPEVGKGLNCLVPAPKEYQLPIPWPRSRDEVWFSNVPHTRLVDDGGQNWISRDNDKFKFPGGGTQFIDGVDKYLDQISQMVSDITFGHHIRVVLDVGCGVASFGAYLLSRNVLTMSIAPKDVHENQIQFALERNVPAMVAAFATSRLLYPSQAFDLIHCSRCRINWTRDDGIWLLEVNRMLRAGGYFAWAAQPVYKHEEALEDQWIEMLNLATRLCWNLVKKEGYVAIWQKPLNNSCYLSREAGTKPPLCDPNDDADNVWYVDLKSCITQLPENGFGANVAPWPARLQTPPDRLQSKQIDAYTSGNELFKAESKFWNDTVESFVSWLGWKKIRLRNVMDMRAGFGGFAAALIENKLDAWVLNVVPVSEPNTLPVIYDRGLLGVMHDWCEPFDTYPRTFDFLHAAGLFSVERKRCDMSTIMLEMDRILRPGGQVYIHDSIDVMDELQDIAKAMGWKFHIRETSEGPYSSQRILVCDKQLLRAQKIVHAKKIKDPKNSKNPKKSKNSKKSRNPKN